MKNGSAITASIEKPVRKMVDVLESLRRLEPMIGPRAQKLWLIYLGSDFKNKKKIEEIIQILSDRYLKQDYHEKDKIFLPPPLPKIADGEYQIGDVIYPEGYYSPFGIKEDEWIQHIGIFGRSGSGKTNVAYIIIKELKKKSKPFLIFDWKKNYRDLLSDEQFKDLLVFTVGTKTSPFFFNPLIPPPGTPPKVLIKSVKNILFFPRIVKFLTYSYSERESKLMFFSWQHFFYFFMLPQGQGSFLPVAIFPLHNRNVFKIYKYYHNTHNRTSIKTFS
jgi:hypothetical protein